MDFEQLTFTPMVKEDIPLLTPIMKRCFDNDSQLFFQKSFFSISFSSSTFKANLSIHQQW